MTLRGEAAWLRERVASALNMLREERLLQAFRKTGCLKCWQPYNHATPSGRGRAACDTCQEFFDDLDALTEAEVVERIARLEARATRLETLAEVEASACSIR